MAEIEVVDGDITELRVDAIANAANTDLRHGGGVAGAIVRAGGRSIQDESDKLAPIGLGEAVATGAGELPATWVIHCATMHLGGPTSAEIIASATQSALRLADELGARSLALVAFGTGVGGFPVDEAARIEVEQVRRHLEGAATRSSGSSSASAATRRARRSRPSSGASNRRAQRPISRIERAKLSAWISRSAWARVTASVATQASPPSPRDELATRLGAGGAQVEQRHGRRRDVGPSPYPRVRARW